VTSSVAVLEATIQVKSM